LIVDILATTLALISIPCRQGKQIVKVAMHNGQKKQEKSMNRDSWSYQRYHIYDSLTICSIAVLKAVASVLMCWTVCSIRRHDSLYDCL